MSTGPDRIQKAARVATVLDDQSGKLARNYAEALLNAAEEAGQAESVVEDLEAIEADVLGPNPRVAEVLGASWVRPEAKDRILVEAFGDRAQPTVVNFLRVLNRHGRLDLLGPITLEARALWDRRQNRRPVTVRSAVPLDDDRREALRGRLARLAGATPIVRHEVDPSLIGGLVVRIGDDVYDGSVRNRLEQLRRQIKGKVHGKVPS